jgi:di/tricarboxylate transporter
MDTGILLVGVVIAGTIILFVSERIRIDLVAIAASLSLAWLGIITPVEAVSGFASNAVIAMVSVMVLGYGFEATGIMSRFATTIVRYAGTGEQRITATISLSAGLISSVMQNIGAAALFLPSTKRIARQTRIPASRLIMPMGFAAILGGTITMIGSGSLIVLNDLLIQAEAEPFSLFTVTPIGLALLIAGVALFALAGNRILPVGTEGTAQPSVAEVWGIDHTIRVCTIPPTSPLVGVTRDEASLKTHYGLDLLAVRTGREITVAPPRSFPFESGQELAFLGSEEKFMAFITGSGCIPSDKDGLKEVLEGGGYGFGELIVRPKASIIGKTPREIWFRQTYLIEPIVHQSGRAETRADFSHTPLAAGDTVLAFGSWEALRLLAGHQDLLLVTPAEGGPTRPGMGPWALLIFAISLGLTFTGVSISLALLTGATGMVLSGILTAEEAYHAIEWKTIALVGGLIPIGIAMEKSGAAALTAEYLIGSLAGAHPIILMAAVAVLATALSLVISNVAATVLLVPLVMLLGAGTGIAPRALALLVAVCASNSFILPTHQVNALLIGPGGYTIRDYLKAGSIMTVMFIGIAVTLIYLLIR